MKIVAEVGLSHGGCLGTALAYIRACANAGADAVKFQCHYGDGVSCFRSGTNFPQDKTRQDYWRRTAFDLHGWRSIRAECHKHKVKFGLSVFAASSVAWLANAECEPDFWKLGSGVSGNTDIVEAITRHRMHEVVLSFGMSTSEEIASAVKVADGLSPTLLQCTSEYPCLPERIGINAMRDLRRHGKPVGLSDHSGTIWPSIIAAYEDASMSEVHVCWSKECWGPDVPASITIDELRQLVQGVRFVERMGSVDKDKMASELSSMRSIFMGNIS